MPDFGPQVIFGDQSLGVEKSTGLEYHFICVRTSTGGRIMRARVATKWVPVLFLVILSSFGRSAAQTPAHCRNILFCLFDQEAKATDPAGIHDYSEDLIRLFLPNVAGDDSTEKRNAQIAIPLADRLAKAEQAARSGAGALVPESAIVKASNDLLQEIGAPPSMRGDAASLHRFREHAASIKAFPALFSADRNGSNCNPGEAVFLLSYLLSENGVLLEGNLDAAVTLMQWDGQPRQGAPGGAAVARMESVESTGSGLLLWYSLHHNARADKALLDHAAATLGF